MQRTQSHHRSARVCLVFAIILFLPALALAGTEMTDSKSVAPAPETPKEWEFRIGIPGWLPTISGDSGVRGLVGTSDVSFSELFDHLTHIPLVLSIDARYRRWEFFGDGQYLEVGASATLPGILFTDAHLHLKDGLIEAFVGYRVIDCEKGHLTLFAGARYNYEDVNLSIVDNGDPRLPRLRELLGFPTKSEATGSIDWVDPVIGARGKVKIGKATSLYAEGDIGGFDANSDAAYEIRREGTTLVRTPRSSEDWSYQLQGGFEFQVSRWFWVQVGYRWLRTDFVSAGFTNKTDLHGPIVQGGVNF